MKIRSGPATVTGTKPHTSLFKEWEDAVSRMNESQETCRKFCLYCARAHSGRFDVCNYDAYSIEAVNCGFSLFYTNSQSNVCFVVFAPLAQRRSIYAFARVAISREPARNELCESLSFFIKAASPTFDFKLALGGVL